MLGGNPEFTAVAELKARGLDPAETPEEYEAAWDEALAAAEAAVKAEYEQVHELGGLYVLGTERHESRRIDNQLRGRAGRQGDPGQSRFYLSLQDDLMRMFNAAIVDRVMQTTGMDDNVPIESKVVSRSIQSAQAQVEAQHFETRKNVLKYDDVMNRQRVVVYDERRRVLEGENLEDQIRDFINDVVGDYAQSMQGGELANENRDMDKILKDLRMVYPVSLTPEELEEAAGGAGGLTPELLAEQLTSDAQHAYDEKEEAVGEERMRDLERRVVMQVLDKKWREHLYEMDYLKEGIGLRSMAQREPIVEYQREGYQLFQAMMESVKEDAVGTLFRLEVKAPESEAAPAGGMGVPAALAGLVDAKPTPAAALTYSAPSEDGSVEQRRVSADGATTTRAQVKKAASSNRADRRKERKGN